MILTTGITKKILFKRWVLHPIFFSAYPVLFYYSHNIGQIRAESIVEPLTITLAASLFGWWILRFILKDWHRSGGIVSLFLILFFSYGHAKSNVDFAKASYALPMIWLGILLAGSFIVIKSKKRFADGTKILNAASIVMLTVVLLNIGIFQIKSGSSDQLPTSIDVTINREKTLVRGNFPDIYFIVLDAYARADVLNNIYEFDNSDFLNFLDENGFYVADKAIANYGQTGLSLGSSLNLTYLDEWVKSIGENNTNREPLNNLIQQSQAVNFLKELGYKIIAFASTRDETQIITADVFLNSGIRVNEFNAGLKNATPLPDFAKPETEADVFAKYRKHSLYMFDKLGEIASKYEGPKFVFAHFQLPHPPFVFGANGESVQLESRFNDHDGNMLIRRGRLNPQQYREHYRDQVIFLNKHMKNVIRGIFDGSSQPPILLVFGDHGPRSRVDWDSVELTDVRESLTILNTYHLPGNGSELLYPGISPINSFRVIFNHYFGTNLELLPDRSYFSPALYLYKFHDVTERVNISISEK